MKTKRVGAKDDDPVYGLYFVAANDGSGVPFQVEVASLLTGEVIPISLNSKTASTRTGRYMNAMRGIQEENFPPHPQDNRDCPRCPYYFICSPTSDED
jgi:CRISPR/Cas system-associated exonuclease Cas4 (RecB family)